MVRPSITELFDLSGRCAVVTGGGMGIGEATALRLSEAGAVVVVTDVDLPAASKTVERIRSMGGSAVAVLADAGVPSDAQKVVEAALRSFGSLDILVNNAGIYFMRSALDVEEGEWDRLMDVNLKGVFFYSQAAAKEMIKGGRGGKIVNIASMDAVHPTRRMAPYDASKGGVAMLTKTMALELAPYGIRVNAVAPGGVLTPGAKDRAAAALQGIPRIPLGRLADPDDIARVVLFLAGAASDYMTGAMVVVDGGFLLS